MKSFLYIPALLGLVSAVQLEKKPIRRLDTVLLRFIDEEGNPFDHDESTAVQLDYAESDFLPGPDTPFGDDKVINFIQINDDEDDTILENVDDSYKNVDFTGISDYTTKSYDNGKGDEDMNY